MKNTVLKIVFLAICAGFPLSAQAATKISDPAKFVADVYASYVKVHDYAPPTDIYTPRLAALFALDSKEAGGEVGRIDFDPWTNSQDPEVSDPHVKGILVFGAKPAREIVVANFKEFKKPNTVYFYFEKTNAGWQLDDMHSPDGDTPWTLSLILKYGWDSGQ